MDPLTIPKTTDIPRTPPKEPRATPYLDQLTTPSRSKRVYHYEPVETTVHGVRKFAYVTRALKGRNSKIPPRPKKGKKSDEGDMDPWGDIERYKDSLSPGQKGGEAIAQVDTIASYPVRRIADQWAD